MSYKVIKMVKNKRGLGAIIEHRFLWFRTRYVRVASEGWAGDPSMDMWVNIKTGGYQYSHWSGSRFYYAQWAAQDRSKDNG